MREWEREVAGYVLVQSEADWDPLEMVTSLVEHWIHG